MKATYDTAIGQVFKDEGGYTNDSNDTGGPTNYGITIHDARTYWKADATANDVKRMPKSVASDIYQQHYALPIGYDTLVAGVDYAVLDYAVNSGVSRALGVLRKVQSNDSHKTIDAIYDEREAFLRAIVKERSSQVKFLDGWLARTKRGRKLAHKLADQYPSSKISQHTPTAGTVVVTTAAASIWPHYALFILPVGIVIAMSLYLLIKKRKS